MPVTNSRAHPLVATILCAGWIWFLWAAEPAASGPVFFGVGGTLLVVSVIALRWFTLARGKLGWAAQMMVVTTLALLMFVIWEGFTLQLDFPALPRSWPLSLKLGFLFVRPLIAAAITAVLFYYPLNVLFQRKHWFVPTAATALVTFIQFDVLFGGTTRALTHAVIVYELLCLLLLVPLFHRLLATAIRTRHKVTD